MAVSAFPAKDLPAAAIDVLDLRADPRVTAGTVRWDGPDLTTGWHRHRYHQVEYAFSGVAEVETAAGHYLLPPQQAIWIPAGLEHNTTLRGVRSVAVFFEPGLVAAPGDRARVLAAAPVIREMILYATRWPIERRADVGSAADAYFGVLARLVVEWLDREVPLRLPRTNDATLARVMAYTDEHLATVTAASVCRVVGMSERSLRRRFAATVGMSWRTYLLQSRLLRAAALLAGEQGSVLDVATAVGFESPSAFTRAFQRWTGTTPSNYRRIASGDA